MFQSYVFFKDNSYYPDVRKRNKKPKSITKNSLMLPEGKGATATTSLGKRKLCIDELQKKIHRVPSVEGATATTSLGILKLTNGCKEINRKNAPNELCLFF